MNGDLPAPQPRQPDVSTTSSPVPIWPNGWRVVPRSRRERGYAEAMPVIIWLYQLHLAWGSSQSRLLQNWIMNWIMLLYKKDRSLMHPVNKKATIGAYQSR